VSKYLALSREGLVEKMACPLDQGLLFSNLDEKDEIFIYCISCKYKSHIGMTLYKKMELEIKNAGKSI
jgi:hypothetical protein